LTQALQQAREQLVEAREEERRRLRRDLHDGLGAALAGIALQAEAARDVLRSHPTEADSLLQEITVQAQATIADVRRLIYGLRPPALDDLGLVGALRVLVASQPASNVQFRLVSPEQLPPLPAAVEVATYRIVQEAITNVVRHAKAKECVIELRTNEAFHLSITDDGRGLQPGYQAGVGLYAMRERAAELGGEFQIESGETSGTCIRATIPLSYAPYQISSEH
jgi:signal transduction histidine kinase